MNTSNTHMPPGANPHVHGGVIATMGRKNLGQPNPKPNTQSVTQTAGPNSYIAAAMYNPPKGLTPNPGAAVGVPNPMSRQPHSINPQAANVNPINNGQDTLPEILMQSPNPNAASKKHPKQHTYTGPLNRTQNPTQIERLQVNQSFGGAGGGTQTAAQAPKMQKVATQGVPSGVAASVDGIHQHQASNGQLMGKPLNQQQ